METTITHPNGARVVSLRIEGLSTSLIHDEHVIECVRDALVVAFGTQTAASLVVS